MQYGRVDGDSHSEEEPGSSLIPVAGGQEEGCGASSGTTEEGCHSHCYRYRYRWQVSRPSLPTDERAINGLSARRHRKTKKDDRNYHDYAVRKAASKTTDNDDDDNDAHSLSEPGYAQQLRLPQRRLLRLLAVLLQRQRQPVSNHRHRHRPFVVSYCLQTLLLFSLCIPSSAVVSASPSDHPAHHHHPQQQQSRRDCPWSPVSSTLLLYLLLFILAVMFKVSKSYSRKANHKREATSNAASQSAAEYYQQQKINGAATANGGSHHDAAYVTSPPPSVRNGGGGGSSVHRERSSSNYNESHYVRNANGQLVPVAGPPPGTGAGGGLSSNVHYDAAYGTAGAQGYSESSTYETREHYERKIRKKTRGERERSRSKTNGLSGSQADGLQGDLDDVISRLTRGIGIVNEKLDLILTRIEDVEARADTLEPAELTRTVQGIVDDLVVLEAPINDLFDDVDILKANNHPRTNEFYRQVFGLHQRRTAYLDRLNQQLIRVDRRFDLQSQRNAERTKSVFISLEEAIKWVRERLDKLNSMVFHEDLEALEELFEQHKIDNRDIQDFNQTVKECIARQAEVSAEDSYEYCNLLHVLESEYQQLRDLSAGRMLDLDSLIAFIRAAQLELIWIHEREDLEVTRNWSDINQLDLPMLQNYYKQLLHEIELREKQFNDVHNQGAALINQRHPAVEVIEIYLRSLQNQWDWLLGLTKCLEGHLRDALNLKSFQEEVAVVEEWIKAQTDFLENNYNRSEFTVDEGERWLRELKEIRDEIQARHNLLMNLAERSAQISPLWQRGERIRQPIPVTAWCDYRSKDIEIHTGDEVTLLDNSDLIQWVVRGVDGVQATVPSVVFRIPPPDPQLTNHLARLAAQLDKMRKLWDRKHRQIRYNMMMSTMKSIQGWDLDTFLSYPPEQRDEIIKALNDDVNKLLSEMDPNDPLALRLKEELRRTNDHFLDLLNQSLRGPEPDISNQFDEKIAELLKKLEEAWKKLNSRTGDPIPRTVEDLERLVNDHRAFEDALQGLDVDVSNVKELFRQLTNPTPNQRANHDYLNSRWEDLWDLSRMYVERLKILQQVLQGITEVDDIVRRHEVTLSSFDDMPAALDKLRGIHSQLLELNMVLQQQESIITALNHNVAQLRQHVARTRFNVPSHPDVDRLEDQVQQLTVRWDNVCSQVTERLRVAEEAQQTQMVYRSQYDEEIQWLDRVEATINNVRRPEQLRPEELQQQLDQLSTDYAQLQEHTATIENINKEGGKFIRDAKNYDNRLDSFRENVVTLHGPGFRNEIRRTQPQPKNGAQIVTEELEALNRRFAQLSSVILERRNQLNVLLQNWKRKQQESYQSECSQQAVQIEAVLAQLSSLPSVRDLDFDFGDSASVSDARVELLRVRERLAELGPLIHRHAEDAAKLSESGVETLSPDQYHALKDARQRLLTTYKSLVDSTDAVLRRLDIATDLLIQFANLSSEFQSWIFAKSRELESLRRRSGYPDRVVESRREHKVVVDSIYARESELRDIGQLAVKIECEIRAYLDELKRSDPNATHPPLQADQVQDTVQRLYDDYERLKGDTRTLDHFLARLKSLSIDHDHNVNDVAQWLGKLERALRDADIHAADRPPLDELLQVFGDLNEEAIGNQAKVDAIVASSKELVEATAATDAHDDLAKQQDALVSDVKRRFDLLNSKINDNLDAVRSELSHKEGVKAGLSGLRAWLDDVERDYARAPDLPLVLDKLNDLKYEEQLMLSGINSHAKVFDDLEEQVEDMKDSAPGVVAAEGLEADLAAVKNRLVRLKSGRNGLHENLLDVIKHLGDFNAQNDAVGKQLLALSDEIDRATGAGETLDDDGMQRMRNDLAQISAEGIPRLEETVNTLLGVPNVTEQRGVTDALAATKKAFARVQQHLDGKVAAAKTFADEKSKFAARVGEVEEKLTGVEKSVAIEAEHVPVDLGALAEQRARTDDLSTKLDDICVLVDGVERLGTSLLQASGANKRRSVDLEGEGAAVTRQVFGLRQRHDEAVRQLRAINDRADSTADHHRKWQTRHDELARWLAQEQAQLAKRRGVNLDKESVKSIVAEGKAADARVTGKEPELVALRSLFATLLDGKQPSDPSMTAQQEALEAAFPALKQDNAALEQLGLDAKAFLDDGASLGQWIGKKTQVLDICRVSAEPAVVADRLTVLNLLKNEIADEQPKWQGFNDRSDGLLQTAPNEPFGRAVAEHVDSVNKQWTALDDAVSQRIDALEKAKQLGLAFDAAQKALRNDLGSVERAVMDAAKIPPTTDAEVAAQLVALERIAADLDAVKTNRASELEKITADLMEAVDPDGAAQSDISSRLEAAKSSIGDLDRRIAGVLDGAREAKGHKNELLVDAANALDWIEQTREDVDALPSLSADPAKLSEQLADLDPIHQVIGNREGAMLLMRAKLAEAAAANAPGAPAAKDTLVRLNDTWEPLLADVKRRHGAAKKAKKLVDEADALDKEIRAGLEAAAHALEEAKASGQPGDTKPVEEALAVLRPKRELLSTTLTKLEALAPGADAKKLRREADNLETDIKDLAKAAEALEKSAGQKNDLLKQLEGSLEGVRGLLASTRASAALDESEGVGKQPVLTKERLRVVIDDLQSKYGRQLGALESAVAALKPFTDDKDKEQIDDEVDELKHAFNELTEQLAVQHDKLLHAENAADEKTAHSNALRSEIDDLADQIRDLRPVECDLEALEKQKTECHDLAAALAEKENALQTLAIEWKALVESGNVPAGAGSVSRDLDALKQKLTAQKKRLADREWAIDETAKQLTGLEKDVEARLAELDAIVASEVLSEPVASEPVDLRRQLTALGQFKANDVKPVAKAVGDVIASCQQLLRNAGSGVPTDLVERQMANVTERLADVNGVVDGRERLLERALNDLGSFNDAYRALLNWIEEIEELVANQKPPSADFKVAKAQLQSHDFQLKSIDEKQSSVENLVKRAQTLSADEQLKATYQKQAENIASRYKALVDDTNSRRMQLLNASMLGEVFAGHFAELSQWLDATERNVQALVNVATDCDVLNEQIERRKELEAEIDDQRANFDELNRVAQELMFLVGADDAVEVQTKAQALSNRYDHLGYRCHALEGTLADIADSVATFLEDANRLDGWLVEADSRLADFDDLPVTPDELVAQSQELADLVSTIAEQQDLVSRVVQDSSELCEHALGNEALVLQSKIEDLKRRYAQLSNESDRRITAMAEALPLSEEVHNAFDDLSAFVAECESDLANVDQLPPDEQQQVIAQLASDAASAGVEMDDLAQKCIQLQHLCSRQKAADLARQAAELKRAVDVLSDKVARKEGDLQSADRQSRQVFDDLDYLIDWFQEARAKVLSLEKPSTELERLQKQLRNQRLMNDDIAKEKADLREIIATATRVARELKTSLGGQELAIASKIEQVKELAEETMRLGRERVEDLEQALELSRDLVDSYDDINRWLEIKGAELESAASITTTTPAEELIAMKRHNDAVLQQYRDQKHILAKFQRNVANLAELCAEDDAQNLAEIADAIVRRFYDQEQEFTRRGRIIEDILDSSAQLGDRLDSMLVNLENETSKIRNAEPPSAQPPLLLRQISDNEALAALFANRQGYFADLKSDAADVLSQLSPNDPSSGQIAAKLVSLDALWVEIQDGLARRHHLLHDTLAKAERFWAELESTKAAVDGIKRNLDAIHMTAADPEKLKENEVILGQVNAGIDDTANAIASLQRAGSTLAGNVGPEDRQQVEQTMDAMEHKWATVTAIYAQMSANLVDAISKSANFHELLRDLLAWLDAMEAKVAALPPPVLADVARIQADQADLAALRSAVDLKAVAREQLTLAADHLYANAHPTQVAAVRQPMNVLNARWNHLYEALNDRQQALERALLEMGQFSEAYEQLVTWIDKTDATLDEIDIGATDTSHIEVQLCKLKVLENDTQAHTPSFEAIMRVGKAADSGDGRVAVLADKWGALTDKLGRLWTKLEISKNAASNRDGELNRWALWLDDILSEVTNTRPIGGLPETAREQLENYQIILADVEEKRPGFEAQLAILAAGASEGYVEMQRKWARANEKLVDRQKKLQIALAEAEALAEAMQAATRWLDAAENRLNNAELISRLPERVTEQSADHDAFVADVARQREAMSDLHATGTKIQFTCEKKDAIPIKNRLISLKHRFDKVANRTTDRTKALAHAAGEAAAFFEAAAELNEAAQEAVQQLASLPTIDSATGDVIRDQLYAVKDLRDGLVDKKPKFEQTEKRGYQLAGHAPSAEKVRISDAVNSLSKKWKETNAEAAAKQQALEDALAQSGKFDDALNTAFKWLDGVLPDIEAEVAEGKAMGTLNAVTALHNELGNLKKEKQQKEAGIAKLKERAQQIINSPDGNDGADRQRIAGNLAELEDKWQRLQKAIDAKDGLLGDAMVSAVDFDEAVIDLEQRAASADALLRKTGVVLPDDEPGTQLVLKQLDDFKIDIETSAKPDLATTIELGEKLLAGAHPAAEDDVKSVLRKLRALWDQIDQNLEDKTERARKHLGDLQEHSKSLDALEDFISAKEGSVAMQEAEEEPSTVLQVDHLTAEHELFKSELAEQQPAVDEAVKTAKRMAAVPVVVDANGNQSGSSPTTPTKSPSKTVPPLLRATSTVGGRNKALQTPEKRRSKRTQRTDGIADRWRKLQEFAAAFDAKLKERRETLTELDRLKDFKFENWRGRYLAWNDHGKARVSDLFRRIDKSRTGLIPRKDLINGILASSFPTTRLEMERVADVFDKGDGFISSKEFMNALRHDPKKLQVPRTEAEMIHDELKKEEERCTCKHKFPIKYEGTNNNRVLYNFGFGGTTKRLVRILRSNVMVRVGGGWEELGAFLEKHDPCRAAGRMNVNIYSANTPDPSQDRMYEFKTRKPSVREVMGYADGSLQAPISKIREKTERSVPMFKKPYSRENSFTSYVSSRRGSDLHYSESKIPRPSPSVSRSGSRMNLGPATPVSSRPPSRMSEASDERTLSRIPSLRGAKTTTTTPAAAATNSSRRPSFASSQGSG